MHQLRMETLDGWRENDCSEGFPHTLIAPGSVAPRDVLSSLAAHHLLTLANDRLSGRLGQRTRTLPSKGNQGTMTTMYIHT